MANDGLSQGQYWGFVVIAITTLSLLKQVSAFRIMLVGHAVGSVLFWSYLRFRSKSMEGHDGVAQFGVAVFITFAGLLFLRQE
jgi:hypothetical protein